MTLSLIAYRYIQAFSQTLAVGDQVQIVTELATILGVFSRHKDWIHRNLHPAMSSEEKAKIFHGLVSKVSNTAAVLQFFAVLAENNRIELISDLEKSATRYLNTLNKQVPTNFVFATEVSDNVKAALVTQFENITNSKVVPSYEINPDILGGFQVYYENKMLDGSILKSIQALTAKTEVA